MKLVLQMVNGETVPFRLADIAEVRFEFERPMKNRRVVVLNPNSLIDSLELPVRAINGLHRAGIHTIEQLQQRSLKSLGDTERGLGVRSINEIRSTLVDQGLEFVP